MAKKAASKIVEGLKDAATYAKVQNGATAMNAADTAAIIAEQLTAISSGMQQLRRSRLSSRALYLLIQDAAPTVKGKKLTVQQIKSVIDGMDQLRALYVR